MNDNDRATLSETNQQLNNFIARMFGEMQHDEQARTRERVKADPQANKLVRLFDKASNYRYYSSKDGKGRKVLFCYSVHRNIAGYFLGWREVQSTKGARQWKRDQWLARKVKKRCIEIARRQSQAQIKKIAALKAKGGE